VGFGVGACRAVGTVPTRRIGLGRHSNGPAGPMLFDRTRPRCPRPGPIEEHRAGGLFVSAALLVAASAGVGCDVVSARTGILARASPLQERRSFKSIAPSRSSFLQEHRLFKNIPPSRTPLLQEHRTFKNVVPSRASFLQEHRTFKNVIPAKAGIQGITQA